ncbi:MAG: hypothetical protein O3A25_00025 [Acidobacteria bacterium]|nr:hypothetical protein [Acidobacteriota bacterium]
MRSPTLNAEGKVANIVLQMMQGECTLEEIARRVRLEFPDRFTRVAEALHFVGDLSMKFGL